MGKASRKKKTRRADASPHRGEGERASNDTTRASGGGRTITQGTTAASILSGRPLWVSLSLIVANLVIYAPVRLYPFVNTDDAVYVTANPNVLRGLSWSNVQWAFTDAKVPYWHPLTFLSHMLDVQAFGTNAGGHHVTNVILHAASTVMLFGLFLQMTGALGRSAVIAGLFGLHPLRVESVAWIAERKDVLSTLFWIATIWAYVRYARRPGTRRYAAVIVLFALGLMAKPMIVTLPFALLLLDYWPLERVTLDSTSLRQLGASIRALLKEKIPLFALAFFASLVTFTAQRQVGAVESLEAVPFTLRAANALNSYVAYIGDLIWPAQLAALYPYPKTVSVASVLTAILVLAAVTALVVAARRKYPYLLVGWLWYLGTLLPVIGLIQVGPQARADRFTYVPHIGLLMMLVWGIPDLMRRWSNRRVVLVPLAACALAACTVVATRQVQSWRDSTTLWEHTLKVTSENGVAHYNLGVVLSATGQSDDAIRHLREAVRLEPDFATAHNRLGLALNRRGDLAGSTAQLAEVVRLMPNSAEAHANLAVSLAKEGKNAEAIAEFSQAVLLNPSDKVSRGRLEFLKRGGTAGAAPR
jgi:tetratricopeptide (TPR) repeat protein